MVEDGGGGAGRTGLTVNHTTLSAEARSPTMLSLGDETGLIGPMGVVGNAICGGGSENGGGGDWLHDGGGRAKTGKTALGDVSSNDQQVGWINIRCEMPPSVPRPDVRMNVANLTNRASQPIMDTMIAMPSSRGGGGGGGEKRIEWVS